MFSWGKIHKRFLEKAMKLGKILAAFLGVLLINGVVHAVPLYTFDADNYVVGDDVSNVLTGATIQDLQRNSGDDFPQRSAAVVGSYYCDVANCGQRKGLNTGGLLDLELISLGYVTRNMAYSYSGVDISFDSGIGQFNFEAFSEVADAFVIFAYDINDNLLAYDSVGAVDSGLCDGSESYWCHAYSYSYDFSSMGGVRRVLVGSSDETGLVQSVSYSVPLPGAFLLFAIGFFPLVFTKSFIK